MPTAPPQVPQVAVWSQGTQAVKMALAFGRVALTQCGAEGCAPAASTVLRYLLVFTSPIYFLSNISSLVGLLWP